MEVEAERLQSELLPPQRSSQELGPWTLEPAHPESAPQLRVRKLCGQFEVLEADSLSWSLVPGEEHGQLEGGDLQVVLAHLVLEGDLGTPPTTKKEKAAIRCRC